ncbi:PTS lactose/cellobiose transporter subunit IIA [Microbacterium sp. H83]|uniref:PTS lactose/cellobiose transporter subunit IIA n=1 Tax=Microbacterium sp. H83 TaxID=1827324 RepID=UPI0007F4F840|nr:PTS lactose/cellobiose transporter subunit IIA [Microbacterium sp. H83]OAN40923.1 PTS cellobiose transporter subunit IIA [Microbacterium sp. H83]
MDEDYEVAFQLIATAGNAKSEAVLAIRAAREGDFDGASKLMDSAQAQILDAHKLQTGLIQQEALGNPVPINIILVHAQDHLTSAMLMNDLAGELIELHSRVAAAGVSA